MTLDEFSIKYSLPVYEKQGLREAAKFWARENFAEKLLILIYILTFRSYPGGISEDTSGDIDTVLKSFIDDSIVSENTTYSSQKIVALFESQKPLEFTFTDSDSWFVAHDLGYDPQVSVIVADEIVLADCIYLNENSLQISFTNPQTGKVILR